MVFTLYKLILLYVFCLDHTSPAMVDRHCYEPSLRQNYTVLIQVYPPLLQLAPVNPRLHEHWFKSLQICVYIS